MKKLTGFVLLLGMLRSFGQSAAPVLEPVSVPDSLVSMYKASFGHNLPLYNGRQFYGYPSTIKEYAFFPVNGWTIGSILYDNMWYSNIPIMYDAYTDEVIVKHPNGVQVILFGNRVQEFHIGDRVFIQLFPGKDQDISNGLYERLIKGKVTVFVKRVKLLEEKIDGLELERKFLPKDEFYILKDNVYTRIKNQQSVFTVFKDKRRELKQYLSQPKIKYKTGRELYIIRSAEFYNKLHQ